MSQSNLDLLISQQEREERLRLVINSASRLRSYRELLVRIDDLERENDGPRNDLRAQLPSKAFDAELRTRLICKEALDALNELRDSGALGAILHGLSLEYRDGAQTEEILRRLENARQELNERFPDVDARFFDDAANVCERFSLTLEGRQEQLLARMEGPDGNTESLLIDTFSKPGDQGRVSPEEFFGADQIASASANVPTFVTGNVHHERDLVNSAGEESRLDVYGSAVAALAAQRELMYRHARTVLEVGHEAFRGEDPFTAILVIAGIVGGVLIIVGAATGNITIAAIGILLLGGALVVGTGGYKVILRVFIEIQA
jgi:hypothetical protein